MNRVAVIDYGMGNLHSVAKALEKVSPKSEIIVTSKADEILAANHVVFPGVGAIRACMDEIKRLALDSVITQVVDSGTPLLGVCVGFQAMMDWSDENGGTDCLGIFPGKVQFFSDALAEIEAASKLKIPHMGWNQVQQTSDHPLWEGITQGARFYFVHSYYVEPDGPDYIAASSSYGFPFTAAMAKKNVFAVQFHPEKSQHAGLKLYENFLNWNGQWDGE